MNLIENIREAFRSVQANLLRTILNGFDHCDRHHFLGGDANCDRCHEAQIEESLSGFGANNFDVRSRGFPEEGPLPRELHRKITPTYLLGEAEAFKKEYSQMGLSTITTSVTGSAEVKRGSKKNQSQ